MLGRSRSIRKTPSQSLGPAISEEGPPEALHLPTGLVNDGNTCFLNSVFQSLIHTPPLNVLLTPNDMLEESTMPFAPAQTIQVDRQRCPALMSDRNEHLDLMPLTASFVEAAGRSWRTELKGLEKGSGDRRGQGLKTLLYNMSKKHDQYGDYDQQDSHEFLRHMLDCIRMEEVDVIKRLRASRAEPSPETASITSSAAETVSDASSLPIPNLSGPAPPPAGGYPADTPPEERDDLVSFVDLLFGGRLASMIVCETCKSVSHTYEDFMDLSMSLPGEAPRERKRDRLKSMASKIRAKLTKPDNYDNDSSAVASDEEDDAGPPTASSGGPTDEQSRSFSLRRMTSTASTTDDSGPKRVPGGRRMTVDSRTDGPPSSGNLGRRNSILSAFGGRKKSVSRRSSAAQSEADRLASRPASPAASEAGEDGAGALSPTPTPFSTAALLAPADSASAEAGFPKLKPSQAQYISQILGGGPAAASAPSPVAQRVRSLSTSSGASPLLDSSASGLNTPGGGSGGAAGNGLMDALRQFTSVEVLEGDNAFACKKCWRFEHPHRDGRAWRRGGERANDSDDDDDDADDEGAGGNGGLQQEGETLEAIKDVDEEVEAQARLRGSDIQALADLHLADDPPPPPAEQLPAVTAELAAVEGLPPAALEAPPAHEAVLNDPDVPTASFGSNGTHQNGRHAIPEIVETPFSPVDEHPPALPAGGGSSIGNGRPDASSLAAPPRSSRRPASATRINSGLKYSNPEFETPDLSDSDTSDASSIGGGGAGTDDETASTSVSGRATPASKPSAKGPRSVMRRAFKRYLIVNPPPILVFHLKRFEQIFGGKGFSPFGGFTTNFKKIDNYVSFPLTVDLAPFFAPARVGAPATTSNLSAKARRRVHDIPDEVNYELTAIVVHLGSMGGGHYISYVLSSPHAPPPPHADPSSPSPPTAPTLLTESGLDSPPAAAPVSSPPLPDPSPSPSPAPARAPAADPRVWFYCSDTVVKPVAVDEVLAARAYLLFYQRVLDAKLPPAPAAAAAAAAGGDAEGPAAGGADALAPTAE